MMTSNHLILIGFMGVGKSSVGKYVAEKLNMHFIDLDNLIENKEKMSILDIFNKYGEGYFRRVEIKHLKNVLNIKKNSVIATGGGIIETKAARKLIISFKDVIWFDISYRNLILRLSKSSINRRPLFDDKVKHRFDYRKKYYRKCANYVLCVDGLSFQEVAEKIINRYR